MALRKGVFIGAYVPKDVKQALQERAANEHRTLTQELTRILVEAMRGVSLSPGLSDGALPPEPTRATDWKAEMREVMREVLAEKEGR